MTPFERFRAARRLGLLIGGEAMQSGLHFALNLAFISLMPAHEYGVFSITMVIGGIGLTYIRALAAMPAVIFIGRSRLRARAQVYEGVFGAAALTLSGLVALVVFVLLRIWTPDAAASGAVFVGFWCVRSFLRTVRFAYGRQKAATIGDFAFATSGGLLAAVAVWRGENLMVGAFLSLAAANLVGSATLCLAARQAPRINFGVFACRFYVRLLRRLGWAAFSVTTANVQGQGFSLLIVAMAGPAAYAPVAAMLVIFVPLRIAATAMVNMIQPEIASFAAAARVAEIWSLSRLSVLTAGAIGVVYGALAMALLTFVKSQSLQGAPVFLIGFFAWSVYMLTSLYVAPRVILEVLMNFRAVAIITIVAAAWGMALIALILEFAAPSWALAGAASGEAIVVVLSWVIAARGLRALTPRSAAAAKQNPANLTLPASAATGSRI